VCTCVCVVCVCVVCVLCVCVCVCVCVWCVCFFLCIFSHFSLKNSLKDNYFFIFLPLLKNRVNF